jgi:molybdate transport system substrate-binding protein
VRLRLAGIVTVAVSALALAACGSSGLEVDGPTPGTPQITGPITVFAASSLKESFTIIGEKFREESPGVTITFNFGASSTLATQITQKAPADVFASASTTTMDTVVQSGDVATPTTFAVNSMAVATPTAPTTPVTSLTDLTKPGVKVAVCQKDVPCGAAAEKLFTQNGLAVTPATLEVDVKSVLSKVQLGEVDAGIVYVTDIQAAKDTVVGVDIPADQNVTTVYPIAPVTSSSNAATAAAFVAYVLSDPGQKVLQLAGFGPA